MQLLACCKARLSRTVVKNKASLSPCVTSLHLRERWSVPQSTLRGFNHTDAVVTHFLVGLLPGKSLLKLYLHIFVRLQQLSSTFYILHSSSWSVSGVASAVWEVQQRQGQNPSIWVQAHQVWTLVLCAQGRLTWEFLRVAFINYTAPKMSSSTSLLHDFPSKQTFPCLFRQFMMLCHIIMLITVTTEAASVLHDSVLNCCLQLWCSTFNTPGTSHKLCLPCETVPFTGEL